jgi:hypothetical protein
VAKSNGRLSFAGNRGGSVTVIETSVARSYWRRAKIGFFIVTATVGLLAGTVATDYLHPIPALCLGVIIGAVAGALVAGLIIALPVLRALWHWAAEICTSLLAVYGWTVMTRATSLVTSLAILVLGVGLPTAVAPIRRRIQAFAWCAIVRHRLRLCFAAFVAANRHGTLPFILLARPTPAGERVWLWLRPGLALSDLEGQIDKLAVACWANEVRVTRASRTRAALIRVDIARRNPLTSTVESPLPRLLVDDPAADAPVSPGLPPLGLNLADIPDEAPAAPPEPRRKLRPVAPTNPSPEPAPPAAGSAGGDDLSAYI